MKKFLCLILLLTTVAYAAPPRVTEWSRVLTTKPATTVPPGDLKGVMGVMSSASGKFIVRLPPESVGTGGGPITGNIAFKQMTTALRGSTIKPYEVDTTAPDGKNVLKVYNTVPFSDPPEEGMFYVSPQGPKWYGTVDGVLNWHLVGSGTTTPSTGDNGLVSVPTFSNGSCTLGQWAVGGGFHYDCVATDTWDRFAYAGWVNLADTTPETFTNFNSQTDVALNTWVYSNTAQISNINAPAAISVTGGSYKIDSGAWTTSPGTINNGQWVSAGHTSAATNSTATTTTVTIGGVAGAFTSTTLAAVPVAGAINTSVTGPLAGGQANVPADAGSSPATYNNTYFFYSAVQPTSAGSVNYAHWNTYSNGSTNRFHVYSVSGGTATALCSSATQTGTGAQPNTYDVALTGCSVNAGTTYYVGVCIKGDSTQYNGPYVADPSGLGTSRRVTIANCGDSFSTTDLTDTQISTTRVIYAYGNNSATR